MSILRLLKNTKQVNQFMIVMMNQHTKLAKVIPSIKNYSTTVARICIESLVENYGISSELLANNGPQIV